MSDEALDWGCARCGHRQAHDGDCTACRQDETLDLRRSQVRELLEKNEQRAHERREGRIRIASVSLGLAIVIGAWFIPHYWDLRGVLYPGLPFLADQWILAVLLGFGLTKVLGKRFNRPLYPWLASLPAPSLPRRDSPPAR